VEEAKTSGAANVMAAGQLSQGPDSTFTVSWIRSLGCQRQDEVQFHSDHPKPSRIFHIHKDIKIPFTAMSLQLIFTELGYQLGAHSRPV